MKPSIDKIFKIKTLAEFKLMAFAVFDYQYNNNEVYREYIISLKVNTNNIKELDQIPFLPIEFFKTHSVISDVNENDRSALFTSSGDIKSKHYVSDVSIYENSYRKGFEYFYGNIKDYIVLALLPSYLERSGSSLIYMAEDLIKRSKNSLEGFYLNNYNELIIRLNELEQQGQKTLLLGVSYALLDLIEKEKFQLNHTIVMETGGMKGKRSEMVREELHGILCKGFGLKQIHSEYGMTELLSQAYSTGAAIFN